MFKTNIEFMDGKEKEYPSRHLSRVDNEAGVFRMMFDHEEVMFPLCNIRRIRTIIISDPLADLGFKDRTVGTAGANR